MRTLLMVGFVVLCAYNCMAQAKKSPETNDPQNMKVKTSQEPFYPGGEEALYDYVLKHVKYSAEAKAKYIEGDVTLSFSVMVDSTVSNPVVIGGIGYGIDEEVKRVAQTLKFAPAIQNGTLVKMNVIYTFPVKAH